MAERKSERTHAGIKYKATIIALVLIIGSLSAVLGYTYAGQTSNLGVNTTPTPTQQGYPYPTYTASPTKTPKPIQTDETPHPIPTIPPQIGVVVQLKGGYNWSEAIYAYKTYVLAIGEANPESYAKFRSFVSALEQGDVTLYGLREWMGQRVEVSQNFSDVLVCYSFLPKYEITEDHDTWIQIYIHCDRYPNYSEIDTALESHVSTWMSARPDK